MATNDKLNYNFVGVQLTSRARTLKGGGGYRSYSYQANWGQTDRFRSEGAAGVSRGKGRGRAERWYQLRIAKVSRMDLNSNL